MGTRTKIASYSLMALLCATMTLSIYWAFYKFGYDDPFITYRYAENLARGLGLVYNPGEKILSTTTPLFALGLALLQPVWPDLPHLANLLGAFSLGLGAICLWDLAHTWQTPWVGWLSLLLYPIFPLLLGTLGSETPLYLASCLGAFAFYARRRYHLTAICAAVAVLTRADGILIPILLGVDYIVRVRRPIPWLSIGLFLGLTAPWFLFAWDYFGSPFPATLAAKQHQGSMAISQKFGPGFFTIVRGYASRPQYWLLTGLAGAGLIWIARSARRWALLLAWTAFYFAAYSVLGVSRYYWYYAPLVPGFLVMAGIGLEALATLAARWHVTKRIAPFVLGVMLAGLVVIQLSETWRLSRHPDTRLPIYRAVGEWLRANTPPKATVGTLEVGIIGYYSQRPMVDFAGLIQPDIAQQLTPETTYQDAARWAMQVYHPDYLVLNPAWFPDLMRSTVPAYCVSRNALSGQDYGYAGNIEVYACDWGAGG